MKLADGPCSECGAEGFAFVPSSGLQSPFLCKEHMRKLWTSVLGVADKPVRPIEPEEP